LRGCDDCEGERRDENQRKMASLRHWMNFTPFGLHEFE
jgi:hypothetical protein